MALPKQHSVDDREDRPDGGQDRPREQESVEQQGRRPEKVPPSEKRGHHQDREAS